MACPVCTVPTDDSSAGHPTLCPDCTAHDLVEMASHPRKRRPDPLGRKTWARGLGVAAKHAARKGSTPR